MAHTRLALSPENFSMFLETAKNYSSYSVTINDTFKIIPRTNNFTLLEKLPSSDAMTNAKKVLISCFYAEGSNMSEKLELNDSPEETPTKGLGNTPQMSDAEILAKAEAIADKKVQQFMHESAIKRIENLEQDNKNLQKQLDLAEQEKDILTNRLEEVGKSAGMIVMAEKLLSNPDAINSIKETVGSLLGFAPKPTVQLNGLPNGISAQEMEWLQLINAVLRQADQQTQWEFKEILQAFNNPAYINECYQWLYENSQEETTEQDQTPPQV